jgi:Transposase
MANRRTADQLQAALKAVERDVVKGLTVGDSCRRHGSSEQSYYRWRRRKVDAADETIVRVRELATEVERMLRAWVEMEHDR